MTRIDFSVSVSSVFIRVQFLLEPPQRLLHQLLAHIDIRLVDAVELEREAETAGPDPEGTGGRIPKGIVA